MDKYSHLSFKYLKQNVSLATVLSDKGILSQKFKIQTNKIVGPCPIHRGDNPTAFVIDLSRNIWHCFTNCNCGGDVIEFVRKLDGKTYRQTAEYLASLANSTPIPVSNSPVAKKGFRPFIKRLDLDNSSSWFQKKGITSKTAKYFEAGLYPRPGFLERCIGVRLHDLNGQPIGYAGRRLNANEAKKYGKWKFPTGLPKSKLLFNFHRICSQMQNGLIIVECPWGVMRLAQLNVPAVGLLGVSLSPFLLNLFQKTTKVLLLLDGDRAGRLATAKLKKELKSHTEVHYVCLPHGMDPDDLNDVDLSTIARSFFSNQF